MRDCLFSENKSGTAINKITKKAIKYIIEKGSINRKQYIKLNNVSHTIAHRELKELVDKNILRRKGAGRYIRYELTQG